jgi:hypothetical protein
MKTKILLVILITAVVTLSFTFASVHSNNANQELKQVKYSQEHNEPVGGLASEE